METTELKEQNTTDKLHQCINECLACAIECEKCATHGITHADKMLVECIALCRDCADICAQGWKQGVRPTTKHFANYVLIFATHVLNIANNMRNIMRHFIKPVKPAANALKFVLS
jgi:hypothetical protein